MDTIERKIDIDRFIKINLLGVSAIADRYNLLRLHRLVQISTKPNLIAFLAALAFNLVRIDSPLANRFPIF
jgi:hypothetical protein